MAVTVTASAATTDAVSIDSHILSPAQRAVTPIHVLSES